MLFRTGKSHHEGRISLLELRLQEAAVDMALGLSGIDASLACPDADSLRRLGQTKQSACFCGVCLYSYLKMSLTGGFAALLLATMPGFFTFAAHR
jgi:hypothetical protein